MRRAAVAVAALPLLLAACGGGSSSGSQGTSLTPVAYVVQAAKKTSSATSEHADMKATASFQGQQVVVSGSGDFDNAKHVGSFQVHANLAGVDMAIDEVLDGTAIYLKSPLLTAGLPQGKTWMKIDLQKVGASKGLDFSSLMSQSPSQSFAQLQASGTVTKVGEETIDGVDTIHYRGRIDPSKLPQAAKIQGLTKATYGPYDVWIGKDDGYVRRMRMSYSVAKQAIALTMSFSDFGKDVTVTVPPAAETADATGQTIQGLGG